MPYYLLYKYDRDEPHKIKNIAFSTEPEAVINACTAIAAGSGWDFEILDEKRQTMCTDAEIRDRCKQTRMP